jgi:hypothetical protein
MANHSFSTPRSQSMADAITGDAPNLDPAIDFHRVRTILRENNNEPGERVLTEIRCADTIAPIGGGLRQEFDTDKEFFGPYHLCAQGECSYVTLGRKRTPQYRSKHRTVMNANSELDGSLNSRSLTWCRGSQSVTKATRLRLRWMVSQGCSEVYTYGGRENHGPIVAVHWLATVDLLRRKDGPDATTRGDGRPDPRDLGHSDRTK